MSKINLKICGITNKASIVRAHQNNVKTLGFASNNLNGPNTTNDKNIKKLIKECNYYKIESVLLTKFYSIDEIINQVDFTKPKTISCSYHFSKNELLKIKRVFKRLRIGVSINPENFNKKYIESICKVVDVIYFDMNVYKKESIKKYSLKKSINQIQFIKDKNIPVYIGGGIDKKNVSNILKHTSPFGLDISRGLKNNRNLISQEKLKDLLNQISIG
jgi:phosphoribosylanthranilate isomerase